MAEADLPQTVTIGGVEYPAVVSDAMRSIEMEMSGIVPDADLSVTIRVQTLPLIAQNSKLTHNGKLFRVMRITYSSCGTCYTAACESITK